eukprot:TRINITY_DN16354_c0_g1_i1.p1 TRINITY_DN16354_c0_g1~~TRINITY_DN16354_c0_g1_i1.p1  ORF type:complete len:115 (+),score=18.77 TRINITY_DN16354_c0_g1_i1:121-465(+)
MAPPATHASPELSSVPRNMSHNIDAILPVKLHIAKSKVMQKVEDSNRIENPYKNKKQLPLTTQESASQWLRLKYFQWTMISGTYPLQSQEKFVMDMLFLIILLNVFSFTSSMFL